MAYDIGVRLGVDGEKAFRSSINAINANIKAMGSELKAVTAQFAKNASSEEALAAKNQVLAKSIAATKDKIGVLDKELERQTEKLRDLGQALDDVVRAHGAESKEALAAQNAYNNQAKAVAKLQTQMNGAKAELAGMENAVKDNKDAIDGLGREVEDAGDAFEEAGQNAVSFGDILKANIISDLVVEGIRKITDGLKDFARFSLESGMNFEAQMSRVQAISGATAEEAGLLADKAKEMGESTVFSATESAQALEYMAMAGWKTDDIGQKSSRNCQCYCGRFRRFQLDEPGKKYHERLNQRYQGPTWKRKSYGKNRCAKSSYGVQRSSWLLEIHW